MVNWADRMPGNSAIAQHTARRGYVFGIRRMIFRYLNSSVSGKLAYPTHGYAYADIERGKAGGKGERLYCLNAEKIQYLAALEHLIGVTCGC